MLTKQFLTEKQVPYEVLEHEPAFDAQRVAHAVHSHGNMVAKPVLLRANHGYRYMVAIVPASKKIDFEVACRSLGDCQLALASEDEVNSVCTECEPGVLPPFGSQYGVKTVVDEALANTSEIIFEGDYHTQAIRMKFEDFKRVENPLVLPLTR